MDNKQVKYSQNNEEIIIAQYFVGKTGVFLDLGANDGSTLSNTRSLALCGWVGLCVEPGAAFAKLSQLYPAGSKVCIANVAIGTENGRCVLHDSGTHLNNGDVSLLSTVNPSEKERWGDSVEWNEKEVAMLDYKTLIDCSPYKQFDFISIDIEGSDLEVLKQIDLSHTACVCVEYNMKENVYAEIVDYCAGFGLTKILLKNLENVICAR